MSPTSYALLKFIHLTCVAGTFVFFFTRGIWMLTGSRHLAARWVRVLPHVIDSLLLASAAGLVVVTRQYPGESAWLNAKIAALILYIALGMIAFRWARGRPLKIGSWVAAQAVFFYIVAVALTRDPRIF